MLNSSVSVEGNWNLCNARICTRTLYYHFRCKFHARALHVQGFVAWCHMRNQRWKAAIRAFAPLVRSNETLHAGKALYWQAYAYQKLGDSSTAKELLGTLSEDYPLSYYEFLGRQMQARINGHSSMASSIPWRKTDSRWVQVGQEAWSWPVVRGALRDTFREVQQLAELNELELARALYVRIRERVERSVPTRNRNSFIGFIAHEIEDYNRGYKATGIRRGSKRGFVPMEGEPQWHAAFPLAYQSLVEKLAQDVSLHPYFVLAIMRAESAYLATAVSHAEAVGALQMIRPTALKVAEELGLTYDPLTFSDPRTGFQYSTYYMQKHLSLWNGNFLLAAASYNAGPEPVAKWLRRNKEKPMPFVVEEFEYNEARLYARRVAEYILRYLELYPTDASTRGGILDGLFPARFDFAIPTDLGY